MEALTIKVSETKTDPSDPEKQLTEELAGAIEYRAHCQTYGWQDWKKDGEIAGTTGNCNCLSYGPGTLAMAHKADEYVDEADIRRCQKVYETLLKEWLWM